MTSWTFLRTWTVGDSVIVGQERDGSDKTHLVRKLLSPPLALQAAELFSPLLVSLLHSKVIPDFVAVQNAVQTTNGIGDPSARDLDASSWEQRFVTHKNGQSE